MPREARSAQHGLFPPLRHRARRGLHFIVKRKDEQAYGEYLTRRVILDIYDAMQQAMKTGTPYHTRLDPPPAHGWTPPESLLEAVTGQQGNGAKEDVAANSLDDIQRHPESAVTQPLLHFKGTE